MEISCPFGIAEELLRQAQHSTAPDTETEIDGKIMVLSGLRVYLPQLSITVHEGIFCRRKDGGELLPEYMVTALVDKETGRLLYDSESDFVETVWEWLEEKISLAELKLYECIVEGIEVREHEKNTMQAERGRGSR